MNVSNKQASATFNIAEDGSVTSSLLPDDVADLITEGNASCADATGSFGQPILQTAGLSLADLPACQAEGQAWGTANDAVNRAAWGALLAFRSGLGGFEAWLNARQARDQASRTLGACCYANDPNFGTPYCSALASLYYPLVVPR
jgi:hypothetical protein